MLERRRTLLVITWMTDCLLFLLIFTVSRGMAEAGATSLAMGAIGGLVSLVSGVTSILGGRVSDRVGRYRVMLLGMGSVALGEIAILLSPTESAAYFAGYVLAAGMIGVIYPPIMAELTEGGDAVRDRSGVGRTIILFCIAWNLGLITGQLSGGFLFAIEPLYPVLVALGLTSASAALAAGLASRPRMAGATVELTAAHHEHRELSASYVRLAWMANLGGTFAMSMIFHLFPKLLVAMEIDPQRHGELLAFSRVVVIATYFVLHRSVFWHHSFAAAAGSQVLAVAGLLAIASARSELGLALGLALLGQLVGFNYFASLYYSTAGSHEERRGEASGMHEGTLSLGFALGSTLGGWAGSALGDRSPYVLAAAVIVALLGVQAFWYRAHVRLGR
jgi:MFS family permease